MSEWIAVRLRGVAILGAVLCGFVDAALANMLAPIDPLCSTGLFECVEGRSDPGIYMPEPAAYPWNTTIEVGSQATMLLCPLVVSPRETGCIDLNDLTRIDPKIELPGDRR